MAKISREKFKVYEGVFDEYTLKILDDLRRKKYYDKLLRPIKTGKEGDVYLAEKGDELRAIKIYRLTSANFKKISEYITRDRRFREIKGSLRRSILVWVQKEYRNLLIAHKEGISVPYPYKCMGNVIVMDYIEGDMLKDSQIEYPEKIFEKIIEEIRLLRHRAKMIHADLSEFNILVKGGKPFLIDMGQSMTFSDELDFKKFEDLYERDIRNVISFFKKKFKLEILEEEVFEMIKKEI